MTKKIDLTDSSAWQSLDWDEKIVHPEMKRTDAQVNRARANRLKNSSPLMVDKVIEANTGKKRTEESKLKMSSIQKQICNGKIPTHLFNSETHKKAIDKQRGIPRPQTSAALLGKPSVLKGRKRPELSKKLKGIPKSEEHKIKMHKPKIKSQCPHCHLMVAPNIMARFHGDNCKHK